MKQPYGERLAAVLRLKGIKQTDLAEELGITQTAVSKIINGSQYLDFDLAVKACDILEISISWLAYGEEKGVNSRFFRNPDRQRIEYLLSIFNEAEYPLVIVAMEELIEVRLNTDNRGKGTASKEKRSVKKRLQKNNKVEKREKRKD
jgi:transcriptional regulator with XRE-family HTH domain